MAEYLDLHAAEPKLFAKVNALIRDVVATRSRAPASPSRWAAICQAGGRGGSGGEQRLVYRLAGSGQEQVLQVAQCRYHY